MHNVVWTALLLLTACGSAPAPEAPAPAPPAPAEAAPEPAAEPAAGDLARGDDADRKSKNGEATVKVGDVDVTVTYGRPEARGREVFGKLVPYGKLWRTGADEATVLTVSGDVKLGDTPVKAGSYALFTVPGEDEWTIVLNSQAKQWGSYDHDKSKDVAKAKAKPGKAPMTEAFTIEPHDGTLYLQWAEVRVPVPLSAP